MRERFASSIIVIAIAMADTAVSLSVAPALAQASAETATAPAVAASLKTPWGEPDLQGIWTYLSDTPLQRPAKFANQEFFTEEQQVELDKERAALLARDKRAGRGTETDVNQGYNSVFMSLKRVGVRTSLIVDPPNGRIPPLTPEAQKIVAADREFRLALLRSTVTCKDKLASCSGGTYDPVPSPRHSEPPPRYNTG